MLNSFTCTRWNPFALLGVRIFYRALLIMAPLCHTFTSLSAQAAFPSFALTGRPVTDSSLTLIEGPIGCLSILHSYGESPSETCSSIVSRAPHQLLHTLTNQLLHTVTDQLLRTVTNQLLRTATNQLLHTASNQLLRTVTNQLLHTVTNQLLRTATSRGSLPTPYVPTEGPISSTIRREPA